MMKDRYMLFTHTQIGYALSSRLGLPIPEILSRSEKNKSAITLPTLVFRCGDSSDLGANVTTALHASRIPHSELNVDALTPAQDFGRVVCDASGIACSSQLIDLWRVFKPLIRPIKTCGRIVVIGRPPQEIKDAKRATAQRALEGFVRALAKEVGKGITVQLIYVATGAEDYLASPLCFLLSNKSAYVSGQVIRVTRPPEESSVENKPLTTLQPLAGKVALVTGAAQGIGYSVAEVLAKHGAIVMGVDLPTQENVLVPAMKKLKGTSLLVDLSDSDASSTIAQCIEQQFGGVDIMVHNAGITLDKRLKNMTKDQWTKVLNVNLVAVENIIESILTKGLLNTGARTVCVSSLCGIAGNAGQTNYATSKAGLIGLVEAKRAEMAMRKATINAVAPAYIETEMTNRMPLLTREVYRRLNSLSQGGLPEDVAETVAWMVRPDAAGVNGICLRVCGQSLIGA